MFIERACFLEKHRIGLLALGDTCCIDQIPVCYQILSGYRFGLQSLRRFIQPASSIPQSTSGLRNSVLPIFRFSDDLPAW